METTIWRNKWTTITIKTFYFVNHQLYIWCLDSSRPATVGEFVVLYKTWGDSSSSGWWDSAGTGGAMEWCSAWLAVGAVTGSGGRVTQLSQAVPSCWQLLPWARGGWDKSKCCDSICDAALASIISRPPTTTHYHQQLTLWTPCGRSLILARASCHQTHLETSKVIKPWKIIFKSSQDLLPDIGSKVVKL